MSEANKALMQRFHEELNRGNMAVLDELFADDYVEHNSLMPDAVDKAQAKALMSMMYAACPDMQRTIEQQVAEGDRVLDYLTYRGTHKGDFMGVAPTGNAIEVKSMMISRIRDGQIVELWAVFDMLTLLRQIGAIPSNG
jgi:steroid delta-isomerase-like uncharacterized protein